MARGNFCEFPTKSGIFYKFRFQRAQNNDFMLQSHVPQPRFRKRRRDSPEPTVKELFMREQNLISEQNHIAAKFLDMLN